METASQAPRIVASTASRRDSSMSRTSTSRRARLGTLLTAPGKTSQTPAVATVSIEPVERGGGLDGQRDLGGREERIMPVRHQQRAGMTTFAVDGDAQTCRRSDRRDHADIQAFRCSRIGPCSMCSSTNAE